MAYYRRVGAAPAKRHTQHWDPNGSLCRQELMGEEGFSSDSSLLYHREIPSALADARPWALPDQGVRPNAPLLPRHVRLHDLVTGEEWKALDEVRGSGVLLVDDDVRLSYAVANEVSPLSRKAIGYELIFVEAGAAGLETALGVLTGKPGDCVLVPRRSGLGRLSVPLRAEHRRLRTHHCPGAPAATGAPGFRRCELRRAQLRVPRKVDYQPLAVPAPYYHSNIDLDEVMFYVAGDYGASKGPLVSAGSISRHPGGHAHGPQLESLRRRSEPSGSTKRKSWSTPAVPDAGRGHRRVEDDTDAWIRSG